jgi:hypothetical protein
VQKTGLLRSLGIFQEFLSILEVFSETEGPAKIFTNI